MSFVERFVVLCPCFGESAIGGFNVPFVCVYTVCTYICLYAYTVCTYVRMDVCVMVRGRSKVGWTTSTVGLHS